MIESLGLTAKPETILSGGFSSARNGMALQWCGTLTSPSQQSIGCIRWLGMWSLVGVQMASAAVTAKELLPIVVAVACWGSEWQDKSIINIGML